jgi:hypothetical protein
MNEISGKGWRMRATLWVLFRLVDLHIWLQRSRGVV